MQSNARVESFIARHTKKLDLLKKMWADEFVQFYNDEEMPFPPMLAAGSVFLAGPTSLNQLVLHNWRCEAVAFLRAAGFVGMIYVPEARGGEEDGDFSSRSYIHHWESRRLLSATWKVFWIPRNKAELLGLNTNLELGIMLGLLMSNNLNGRLLVGWPTSAERMGLPGHYAWHAMATIKYSSLETLCQAVMEKPAS